MLKFTWTGPDQGIQGIMKFIGSLAPDEERAVFQESASPTEHRLSVLNPDMSTLHIYPGDSLVWNGAEFSVEAA